MSVFQGVRLLTRKAGIVKPTGRLQINWNNPLTQMLSFFACEQNGRMVNLCRPADQATLVGGSTAFPKRMAHQTGTGLLFDGSSSLYLPQRYEDQVTFNGGKKTIWTQFIRTATSVPNATPFCRTANNSLYGNAVVAAVGTNLLLDARDFTTGNWSTNGATTPTLTSNSITNVGGFWNLDQDVNLTIGHTYTLSARFFGVGHSFSYADSIGQHYSADNAESFTFTPTDSFNTVTISNASGTDPGQVIVTLFELTENSVAAPNLGVLFMDDSDGPIRVSTTETHAVRSIETIGGHVAIPAGGAQGIYLDGFLSNTATFNNSSTSIDTNANFIFSGTSDSAVNNPFQGIVNFGLYATRSWATAEMLEFYKAPWQIVKPYPRRTYFDGLTSTTHSIDVTSAEFGTEMRSPTITFGGAQNATPAEFGWEKDDAKPVITQKHSLTVTPAEFSTTLGIPTLDTHSAVFVQSVETGFEVKSLSLDTPGNFFPDSFKAGFEVDSINFRRFISDLTPESRTFNVPLQFRIVLIRGTFPAIRTFIRGTVNNPFSATPLLCSSGQILCSSNINISTAVS